MTAKQRQDLTDYIAELIATGNTAAAAELQSLLA